MEDPLANRNVLEVIPLLRNILSINSHSLDPPPKTLYVVPFEAHTCMTCGSTMDDAWNGLSFDFEPAVEAALPASALANAGDFRFRTQVYNVKVEIRHFGTDNPLNILLSLRKVCTTVGSSRVIHNWETLHPNLYLSCPAPNKKCA